MKRKNTRRFDPRYFMDEKTEVLKEELKNTMNEGQWESESDATNRMMGQGQRERFTGGSVDIDPLSDEEQTAGTEAYYELYEFLASSNLPGDKPSDKLQYALRWIAKFEQGGANSEAPEPEEEVEPDPADSPFTRPKAARYR